MPDELPPLSNDPIKFPGIPPLPPPLPIYRREDYGSVAGRKITEWVHVEGTPEDPDCPRFIGTGGVPIEETFRSPDGKTAQKQTRIASVNFIIPVDNILFASEMIGAVRGIDPETGHYYDDTKRYIEATLNLSEQDRFKVYEGNARRVYPRLDAALKAKGR